MIRVFWALVLTLSAFEAGAEEPAAASSESTVSTKIKQEKLEDNGKMVDPKLRAEGGSLSRWSLKARLSYYGPGVSDFGAKNRPNPDGTIGNFAQYVDGTAMVRYKLNKDSAVNVGFGGITVNRPFHGIDRTSVAEPFVGYDTMDRFGDLQMINSIDGVFATTPEYVNTGEVGGLLYMNRLAHPLGGTRFSVALESELGYWAYKRGFEKTDGRAEQWGFKSAPILRFNASDRFNIFTSTIFYWSNPRSEGSYAAIQNRTVAWNLGAGFAVARDIYLAGYLQSFPIRLSTDNTTLNMNAVFSIL